jgi:acetyl-CoA carboxylase carboxyl transferase subunit alpha
MLEHAYYSVISPEGCAGILWKSHEYKDKAAEALKMRSKDLLGFGVIEEIIEEPLGGAHRDPHLAASRLKHYLRSQLKELARVPADQLVTERYSRFRKLGVFEENKEAERNPR